MELQMENIPVICIESLIKNVTSFLSGNANKNCSVVKVNNENLATNGELYFLPSLKAWRRILRDTDNECDKDCKTILQHYLHIKSIETDGKSEADITEQVLKLLIASGSNCEIKINKYFSRRERICLFLQRIPLIENSIKAAVTYKEDFGNAKVQNFPKKIFSLKSLEDAESELTTKRLHLIQGVTEKLLNVYGCKVSERQSDYKIIFTSKSQRNIEENYEKCVCGVVKNIETKCKDTKLSWQQHIQNKVKELKELSDQKYFETQEGNVENTTCFLTNLAQATAMFELLSAKPSRPVFIGCNFATDKNTTNTKGAPFILYNTARIATIIEKYDNKSLRGEYPNLLHINHIDFSLINQEEEWELIYNFIIGYHEMLKECLKYETVFQINPQVICIFLSRLCQKFSIYYRRTKILTEAYSHLIPTMMARVYLLHALQVVLRKALALLDIVPVSRM